MFDVHERNHFKIKNKIIVYSDDIRIKPTHLVSRTDLIHILRDLIISLKIESDIKV